MGTVEAVLSKGGEMIRKKQNKWINPNVSGKFFSSEEPQLTNLLELVKGS